MKNAEFENLLKKRLFLTSEVLTKKGDEYATEEDRFHNFKAAGRKEGISPVAALKGMMLKHVISVDDLIRLYETNPSKLKAKVVEEKIGDYINYLILMEGLFMEVVPTSNKVTVEEESGNNNS